MLEGTTSLSPAPFPAFSFTFHPSAVGSNDKVFLGSPGSSFYQLSVLRAMASSPSSPLLPRAPVRASRQSDHAAPVPQTVQSPHAGHRSGELFLPPSCFISYLLLFSSGLCVSASHNIRSLETNTNFTHSVFCRLKFVRSSQFPFPAGCWQTQALSLHS